MIQGVLQSSILTVKTTSTLHLLTCSQLWTLVSGYSFSQTPAIPGTVNLSVISGLYLRLVGVEEASPVTRVHSANLLAPTTSLAQRLSFSTEFVRCRPRPQHETTSYFSLHPQLHASFAGQTGPLCSTSFHVGVWSFPRSNDPA